MLNEKCCALIKLFLFKNQSTINSGCLPKARRRIFANIFLSLESIFSLINVKL